MSFFVRLLSEDNPDEVNKKIRSNRINAFENILRQQFHLSYFGHISYEASESMSVFEREYMYHILSDQKADERKQQEEALKAQRAARSSRHR